MMNFNSLLTIADADEWGVPGCLAGMDEVCDAEGYFFDGRIPSNDDFKDLFDQSLSVASYW